MPYGSLQPLTSRPGAFHDRRAHGGDRRRAPAFHTKKPRAARVRFSIRIGRPLQRKNRTKVFSDGQDVHADPVFIMHTVHFFLHDKHAQAADAAFAERTTSGRDAASGYRRHGAAALYLTLWNEHDIYQQSHWMLLIPKPYKNLTASIANQRLKAIACPDIINRESKYINGGHPE